MHHEIKAHAGYFSPKLSKAHNLISNNSVTLFAIEFLMSNKLHFDLAYIRIAMATPTHIRKKLQDQLLLGQNKINEICSMSPSTATQGKFTMATGTAEQ